MNTLYITALSAQTAPWMSARIHSPAASLQRLPEVERATIYKLLRPQLGPLFQGDAPSVADDAIRSFRAERVNLAGTSAVAVQATGNELCGIPGNCSFWVIDLLHRRVILHADGVLAYAIESANPHMMPDVVTATQASALEQERIRWAFLAGQYKPQSCATIDYADASGTKLSQPEITPHPCSTEGN